MHGRRILAAGVNRLWRGVPARTRGIAVGVAVLAAVAAVATATLASGGGSEPRPNILVILTDDQRADGTLDVMPVTRQWFQEGGTEFTRAFVTTPECCPSRSSIFSGRYAHNHGVLNNQFSQSLDQRYTLQRYLRQSGYLTGIYGKYLNAWNPLHNPPDFDKWSIWEAGYTPIRVNEQGIVKTVTQYATSYISSNASQFLQNAESNDSQPWFLYLSTTAPHSPFTPEAQYANASVSPFQPNPAQSEADRSDKPPLVQSNNTDQATVESTRTAQLRTLMSVDDLVSNVFQTLEATGEASNTLAIFLSDNGYNWGDHGLIEKGWPYEEDLRVPWFIRWPGHVTAGATDSRLVTNVDLAPTLLDAAGGVSPTVPMDGRSIFGGSPDRTRILTEINTSNDTPFWASLRTPTYKYIERYGATPPRKILFREYYDLSADPYELDNLLADGNSANDPPTAQLSAQLAADLHCAASSCP
jgi:arylsulfatase A-like enzyme